MSSKRIRSGFGTSQAQNVQTTPSALQHGWRDGGITRYDGMGNVYINDGEALTVIVFYNNGTVAKVYKDGALKLSSSFKIGPASANSFYYWVSISNTAIGWYNTRMTALHDYTVVIAETIPLAVSLYNGAYLAVIDEPEGIIASIYKESQLIFSSVNTGILSTDDRLQRLHYMAFDKTSKLRFAGYDQYIKDLILSTVEFSGTGDISSTLSDVIFGSNLLGAYITQHEPTDGVTPLGTISFYSKRYKTAKYINAIGSYFYNTTTLQGEMDWVSSAGDTETIIEGGDTVTVQSGTDHYNLWGGVRQTSIDESDPSTTVVEFSGKWLVLQKIYNAAEGTYIEETPGYSLNDDFSGTFYAIQDIDYKSDIIIVLVKERSLSISKEMGVGFYVKSITGGIKQFADYPYGTHHTEGALGTDIGLNTTVMEGSGAYDITHNDWDGLPVGSGGSEAGFVSTTVNGDDDYLLTISATEVIRRYYYNSNGILISSDVVTTGSALLSSGVLESSGSFTSNLSHLYSNANIMVIHTNNDIDLLAYISDSYEIVNANTSEPSQPGTTFATTRAGYRNFNIVLRGALVFSTQVADLSATHNYEWDEDYTYFSNLFSGSTPTPYSHDLFSSKPTSAAQAVTSNYGDEGIGDNFDSGIIYTKMDEINSQFSIDDSKAVLFIEGMATFLFTLSKNNLFQYTGIINDNDITGVGVAYL